MSEDWGICTKNEPHSASHAVRPAVFNAADARHSPLPPRRSGVGSKPYDAGALFHLSNVPDGFVVRVTPNAAPVSDQHCVKTNVYHVSP